MVFVKVYNSGLIIYNGNVIYFLYYNPIKYINFYGMEFDINITLPIVNMVYSGNLHQA